VFDSPHGWNEGERGEDETLPEESFFKSVQFWHEYVRLLTSGE